MPNETTPPPSSSGTVAISLVFVASVLLAAIGSFYYFDRLNQINRAFGVTAALLAAAAAIGAAYVFLAGERGKGSDNVVPAAILLNVVIFLSGGLVAVLAASDEWLPGLLWAVASLLAGGLLGLLLSLPSTDDEANGHTAAPNPAPQAQARKRQITALGRAAGRVNQVIGGGIAFNWDRVYAELKMISRKIGACIGVGASQPAVAGAGLLFYFGILGLISGILLTRIFLNRLLDVDSSPDADTPADTPASAETPPAPNPA